MNPLQPALGGSGDAFVAQLTADGTAPEAMPPTSAGVMDETGMGALPWMGRGQAFVLGTTSSTDFPTTLNSFQPSRMAGRF